MHFKKGSGVGRAEKHSSHKRNWRKKKSEYNESDAVCEGNGRQVDGMYFALTCVTFDLIVRRLN